MNHKKLFAILICSMLPAAAMAADGQALAQKNNCLGCHAVDHKLVGPAYKDIAQKYAGNSKAKAMLMGKIKQGGSGTWGSLPMPPNPQVSDADLAILVSWVLQQK